MVIERDDGIRADFTMKASLSVICSFFQFFFGKRKEGICSGEGGVWGAERGFTLKAS